jgi:PAS domain S-box-containing protein
VFNILKNNNMGSDRNIGSDALENMISYFHTSPDLLFVFNSAMGVVEANKTALDKLHYNLKDIKSKTIFDLHPATLKEELNKILETVEGDKIIYSYLPLVTSRGEIINVETNISGGTWNGNKAIFTSSKDVRNKLAAEETARKSLELLRKSEEKYRRFFENAQDVFYLTDTEGRILEISPSIMRYSGYKPEELIGKQIESIYLNPFDKDVLHKILSSKGGITDNVVRLKIKDAGAVYVSASVQMLYGADGSPIGVEGSMRDVTQRFVTEEKLKATGKLLLKQNKQYIKLNEELKKAKEKAEESDRLKTAFLANMSHEIRTPMNGIMGFSMMLADPGLTQAERDSYVKIVNSSCDQLLHIINDIIDISKIEAGQIDLSETTFDLNLLLREILSFHSESVREKEIELLSIPLSGFHGSDIIIRSDRTKLRQILDNLISNAIKFTKSGKITLRCFREEDYLFFEVEDTGIGIQKEHQEAVFHRFFQAETSLSRAQSGTGLGLSITKAYVELMGGKIWLRSEPGMGSTFGFSVPYKKYISEEKLTNPVQVHDFSGIHPTVLVVEDEEINRLYIAEILKKVTTTVFAKTGMEALEKLDQHPEIDLILMDIKLPDINGLELTRIIKAMKPDIRVVAQSAYALAGDKEKAFEAGCSGYITKPLKRDSLLDLISSHI